MTTRASAVQHTRFKTPRMADPFPDGMGMLAHPNGFSGARFCDGSSFGMENPASEKSSAGSEVAAAVERLAVARLGRALPPLAVLAAYGLIQSMRFGLGSADYLLVFVGALGSAGSMLAYGTEAVKRVMEKRSRWAGLISVGSFVPYLFGGYLIVTRGQQLVRTAGELGAGGLAVTLALILLAVLCIRAQWKLTEVHLLAREMAGLTNVQPQ